MTIDESILYMELYKRKLFDSVSDLDKDIEAYNIAIDIMHKYQKIKDIVFNGDVHYRQLMHIREVIEDGKND